MESHSLLHAPLLQGQVQGMAASFAYLYGGMAMCSHQRVRTMDTDDEVMQFFKDPEPGERGRGSQSGQEPKAGTGRGQDGSFGAVLRPPCSEAGRGAESSQTGLFVRDVDEARREHGATGALRYGSQMEGSHECSRRAGIHPSTEDHASGAGQRSTGQDKSFAEGSGHFGQGNRNIIARRQQGLELPEMEHAAQVSQRRSGADPQSRTKK